MIKFIHTADIHFGMENYGRIDAQTGIHSRLLDFKRALDFCIDTAIAKEVDFFLFAGDAYKTAHPSPTQQRLLMQCFLRLYKANIPVVIIVGNHDNPLSFGKAHSLDLFNEMPLDGFYVVSKPTTIKLETKNGPINIVGIPWPTRNTIALSESHRYKTAVQLTEYISDAVSKIIAQKAAELDPNIPAVLSSHLTVSNGIFSGSEKRAIYGTDPILLPSQLAIKPFDYVALGHLHRYQNLNPKGHPAIVYSGSIERVDFGERKEDKGFCLVTFKDKKETTHEFIKTPMRPFIQIEAHVKPGPHDQTQDIIAELEKYDISGAIVKILYHLPPGRVDRVDLKKLQKYCADVMYLVGIIPVRKPAERQRRTSMNVEMDLPTLLNNYFATKPELADKKEQLIEKAVALQNELDQEAEVSES